MAISDFIIIVIAFIVVVAIFILFFSRKKYNVKVKPTSPSLVKGFSAFFDGDYNKAIEELKAVALADRATPEIYLTIGFLYRKIGDYKRAAQVHEVLLGYKDVSIEYRRFIQTELAKDYLLASMPKKAIEVIKTVDGFALDPENLLVLAKSYMTLGDYDNAIVFHNKYEKATGKSIYGFIAKANIEKALQDKNKQNKYIITALEVLPSCRAALFMKAAILQSEAKHIKSFVEYKNILQNDLVRTLNDLKVIDDAFLNAGQEVELYQFVLSLANNKSSNPFVYIFLADKHLASGEKELAIRIIDTYLETNIGKDIVMEKYAELTENFALKQLTDNLPNYECKICGSVYKKYSDDCVICKSYDSLVTK